MAGHWLMACTPHAVCLHPNSPPMHTTMPPPCPHRRLGLHTLCLLDIKVKEPNLEMLARGKHVYEPPRYMSVSTAVEQLLELEERRGEGVCGPSTLGVGIARLGADDQVRGLRLCRAGRQGAAQRCPGGWEAYGCVIHECMRHTHHNALASLSHSHPPTQTHIPHSHNRRSSWRAPCKSC